MTIDYLDEPDYQFIKHWLKEATGRRDISLGERNRNMTEVWKVTDMTVWVVTDQNNEFISVHKKEEEALKQADYLEKCGEYPLDSLYVDGYGL